MNTKTKRNPPRLGGGLPRADIERIRHALERLRGRVFQIRDFMKLSSKLKPGDPGYHSAEARFYSVLRSGACAVVRLRDRERTRQKHRFYEVVDPNLWQPRALKERRKPQETRLAPLIGREQSRPSNNGSVERIVQAAVAQALEAAGIAPRRRAFAGEYTFCLVRADDVARANSVLVLQRMAEDKMHVWGLGETELLRDHIVLSSSQALPSIPKWRELGIEVLGTVKARGKAQAEAELLSLVTTPTAAE